MDKIYFDEDKKILRMLENDARLVQTDEDKSEFSYDGKKVVVSTPYLNRLMAQGYDNRSIESLTGIGLGLAINSAKGPSSYSQLSQTEKEYEKILELPRKPQRLFD